MTPEVIFRQTHEPEKIRLSDFTAMRKLRVTITDEPLDHRLYHFRLAYSGFQHAHVILGGESYVALDAQWRTSQLSHKQPFGGFQKPAPSRQRDITDCFEALCQRYGMTPRRNSKTAPARPEPQLNPQNHCCPGLLLPIWRASSHDSSGPLLRRHLA